MYLWDCCTITYPLLPISDFVLNEKFQRNASKFSIFYIYENLKLLFSFRANLFFPLMNAPVYGHRPGHSLGEKNKVARNEKWKKQLWVFVYIKYGKFWSVSLELFVEHKLWNWEECFCMNHDLALTNFCLYLHILGTTIPCRSKNWWSR